MTTVGPVYVFAPERISVPAPVCLVRPPSVVLLPLWSSTWGIVTLTPLVLMNAPPVCTLAVVRPLTNVVVAVVAWSTPPLKLKTPRPAAVLPLAVVTMLTLGVMRLPPLRL